MTPPGVCLVAVQLSHRLLLTFFVDVHIMVRCRMESTEKCEAIIQHFNGKYIKTPPGVPGQIQGSESKLGFFFKSTFLDADHFNSDILLRL